AVGVPGAEPSAVAAAEVREEELAVGHGGREPALVAGGGGSFGERREHHRVPLGEHLVVAERPGTLGACREELGPGRLDNRRTSQRAAVAQPAEDRASLEVRLGADLVPLERGG